MRTFRRESSSAGFVGVGIAAVLATAAIVYFMDPASGNRRRARLRDKWHSAARGSQRFLDKAGRDAAQRARGVYREATNRLRRSSPDDEKLEHRVRTQLGRLTTHPRAIEVECRNGTACLRGDVLAAEAETVLAGIWRVNGVQRVDDQLQRHERAERISSLQGEGRRRSTRRFEYLQANWSPAPRVLAGAAGAAMIIGAFTRRSPAAYALAAGGGALMLRAVANLPFTELLGVGTGERSTNSGVVVQKTIQVYAEPDEVYRCWRDLEQLPQFMSHVREIRKLDDTRYHWIVDGPAGLPVQWDSTITADEPNELIAWRTAEGATVHSMGIVHFEPSPYGGTRVHVRMSYRPPANALGHTVAKIFGRDPKHQMDGDLLRFKHFMEAGAQPRDAAQHVAH